MAFSLALTQAMYVFLFLRDKGALGQYDLVPAGVIAETLGMPKPSVVKILKCLTQAGIVVTGTGVSGGAKLTPEARQKTLYDLFTSVEGRQPLFRTDHEFPARGARPDQARQAVAGTLDGLERTLVNAMKAITLGSLVPEEPLPQAGP